MQSHRRPAAGDRSADARARARLARKTSRGPESAQDEHLTARSEADVALLRSLPAGNRALVSLVADRSVGRPAGRRSGIGGSITSDHASDHISRHASWEHKMLGDVDPDVLEVIASGRDVAKQEKRRRSRLAKTRASAKTIRNDQGEEISIDNVLHTIDQEIRRLRFFKDAPPSGTVAEATARLQAADAEARLADLGDLDEQTRLDAEREIEDAQWDVRLAELTLSDGTKFLVTYGELNTLADFYGSRAELQQTPADNFRGILGGVREESYRKFMRLRNELTVAGPKPYKPDAAQHAFQGAIGNKGESPPKHLAPFISGDQYGELKLMGEMGDEARQPIPGREETTYTAGLARNACHFAPHSWHAWAASHTKAEALARQAGALRVRIGRLEGQNAAFRGHDPVTTGDQAAIDYNQGLIDEMEVEAAAKQNEAVIENAFGDHFLQDSYAAGHLINKTLIMQWFATWLDGRARKRDYSTEEQWRRIQQIAYGQDALAGMNLYDVGQVGQQQSNDPQSVENIQGDDWEARMDALGLTIPQSLTNPNTDAWRIFTWWQDEAMNKRLLTTDAKELSKKGPVSDDARVKAALRVLIDDGVVFYKWFSTKDRARGAQNIGIGTKSLRITEAYIPKIDASRFRASVQQARGGDVSAYVRSAKAVTYGDYHNFLNHGYLQLASNVLHDHFCKKGLDVAMARGDTPYKIYGDNAMLGKDSARMVKYSAETARMSRDSIYELATTGATTITTAQIAARFPTFVRPKGTNDNLKLDEWHGEDGALRRFCDEKLFDRAAALFSKSTVAAKAALATQVSKDAVPEIHVGEAF